MAERQGRSGSLRRGEGEPLKAQCLKRKLYHDDRSRFVVFLASEEAGACTSQQYVVDGGWV
jgi:NAD(P)-dependent dehydrogenase (short-subunit alcohol dehydrogenase family)